MEFMSQLIDPFLAEPRWLTVSGLTLDSFGAVIIAWGVIVSQSGIDSLVRDAGVYYGTKGSESSPSVRDRIKQSRLAKIGGFLLVLGFVLQILGNWPR